MPDDETYQQLLREAEQFVATRETVGPSAVQRHVRVGFAKAARILGDLEASGKVSPADGCGRRRVLAGQGGTTADDTKAVTFWAEIPRGDDARTGGREYVVGARLEVTASGTRMIPVGPPEIAADWPRGWLAGPPSHDDWVEVDGPARMLSRQEHRRIVAGALEAGNRVLGHRGDRNELSAALAHWRKQLSDDAPGPAQPRIPFTPDGTIPPGDILATELLERGTAVPALAAAAGLDPGVLQAVIDGTRPIGQAVAEGLHKALGPSVQFWLNLQRNHDQAVTRGATVTRLTGAQDD
jgi:plasmid maintenance system antidote protein VapI